MRAGDWGAHHAPPPLRSSVLFVADDPASPLKMCALFATADKPKPSAGVFAKINTEVTADYIDEQVSAVSGEGGEGRRGPSTSGSSS